MLWCHFSGSTIWDGCLERRNARIYPLSRHYDHVLHLLYWCCWLLLEPTEVPWALHPVSLCMNVPCLAVPFMRHGGRARTWLCGEEAKCVTGPKRASHL